MSDQSPGEPRGRAALELLAAASICAAPLAALAALFDVGPRAPRALEVLLWLELFWVLARRVASRRPTPRATRAASWLCALLALHAWLSLRAPGWLGDETRAEFVSRASAELSRTWHGVPWTGLAYAWGTCAFAWLARELIVDSLRRWALGPLGARAEALALVGLIWTLGLGAMAVLGYATGSPWPLPG